MEKPKGVLVYEGTRVVGVEDREGCETGLPVGIRSCQLSGCRGHRIGVRWPNGRLTWPCMKGMRVVRKRVSGGETTLKMRII